MKTIKEQLAAAKRELEMRKLFYPGRVHHGKMTRDRAQHEIDCMESICATLEKLQHLDEASEDMRQFKLL